MVLLLKRQFSRTLDTLSAEIGTAREVEIWSFDDRASRERATRRLARAGIKARCRSAYKPLLHFFLEDVERAGLAAVTIDYPVHPHTSEGRFRLEAYPLSALLAGVDLSFRPKESSAVPHYDVTLFTREGERSTHEVFAPNRLHRSFRGAMSLSPTGWLRLEGEPIGRRVETDYEMIFQAIMDAVGSASGADNEAPFPEFDIRVAFPATDEPLGKGLGHVSLREALHEDIYFSLLDLFHHRSGRAAGERTLQPGRILPNVVQSSRQAFARVERRAIRHFTTRRAKGSLEDLPYAPDLGQIKAELEKIGGRDVSALSVAGRRVRGRYIRGSDVPVVVSAGQHANETSGVVGCLRAAAQLAKQKGANFAVAPVENPDGYALHQHLCRGNPCHMHHAARFTALGDDLEHRVEGKLWEKQWRIDAQKLTGAALHINLHGYPAHEWTRPLSGYIPHDYEKWTLPKGFFLILRHHQEWKAKAMKLLHNVTHHLSSLPDLMAFNAQQISLYEAHAGATGFEFVNGYPCLVSVDERSSHSVTLITEYPDETIYDDEFVAGHTAQMEAVLAAYRAWQVIEASAPATSR